MARPSFIDLFAGCGGLILGLMQAGWKGLFAIEHENNAFLTLQHNLLGPDGHLPNRSDENRPIPLLPAISRLDEI